jgi:paraquat-inducible protein B
MPVERSYARLGLFLVVSLIVVFATALFFIQRFRTQEVLDLVSYTTGDVSGLNTGSVVRFRGVPIGRVEELRIDPRGTLIEVDFEVFLDRLTQVGSNVEGVRRQAASGLLSHLRAQVVGNPVTGDAYLLLDMPANPPPPIALTFTPTRVHVPFMPTAFQTAQDRLPALMDRAVATLQTMETIVARVPASLDRSDRFFDSVEQVIREADLPALSADSRRFFTSTTTQMEQITANLDRALGPHGTLATFVEDTNKSIAAADLEATTKSTRDAMNQTNLAADDLRRSLPAIRDALAQLRDLARMLEEQPESVIYGQRSQRVKK